MQLKKEKISLKSAALPLVLYHYIGTMNKWTLKSDKNWGSKTITTVLVGRMIGMVEWLNFYHRLISNCIHKWNMLRVRHWWPSSANISLLKDTIWLNIHLLRKEKQKSKHPPPQKTKYEKDHMIEISLQHHLLCFFMKLRNYL